MMISQERLVEMLETAIKAVEAFQADEYSSYESYYPAGMTMREYDFVCGLDSLQNIKNKIKSWEESLQNHKLNKREQSVSFCEKYIQELKLELAEVKKNYDTPQE